jgi:hypothetical protein
MIHVMRRVKAGHIFRHHDACLAENIVESHCNKKVVTAKKKRRNRAFRCAGKKVSFRIHKQIGVVGDQVVLASCKLISNFDLKFENY